MEDALKLFFLLVFVVAFGFAIDAGLAQMVLFTLGGFHVIAGFWQAFLTVITAELVIGAAVGTGNKATK